VPAFRRAAGVRLVAAADVDPARPAALVPEVPAYDSMAALVTAGGVDGVVIATPTRSHLADAAVAAAAGLPALVEKPPGVDASEAAGFAALRPPPWIGLNRRFEPELARLREQLAAQPPAELVLAMQARRQAWGAYDARDDALLDLAPHLLDLARWLTRGEILQVRAGGLGPQRAVFELTLSRSRATVHCATDRVYTERVEARDDRRRVVARYRRGGLVRAVLDRLHAPAESPLIATLTRQLEAFGRAVRGGDGAPLATPADGLAVMSAVDAVRRSAAGGGRWETVVAEAARG
jgi:myo-inositol 2-dehydrogenase/D-chiro-inositol 1-dehydrogenase